jgi:hypothetical protein
VCCTALGEIEEAVEALRRATQITPTFKEAWGNLGQVCPPPPPTSFGLHVSFAVFEHKKTS